MKLKKLSPMATLILFSIFLAPCSLEHYSADRTVQLKIQFPSKATGVSEKLLRPAGTDDSYIPPFVDRISITPSSDNCGELFEANRYPENNLTDQYEFDWDYSDCSFDVKAYTCTCSTFISDCGTCPAESQIFTQTHEASFSTADISSSGIDSEIKTTLQIKKGAIDANARANNFIFSEDDVTQYCLAMNDRGYFGVAWHPLQSAEVEDANTEIFNYGGAPSYSYAFGPSQMLNIQSGSCLFNNDNFYTTFNSDHNLSDIIWLLKVPSTSAGTASPIKMPFIGEVANLSDYNSIDSAYGISAMAWVNSTAGKMAIFDNDSFTLNGNTSIRNNLCTGCTDLHVKILGENRILFAGFSSFFTLISMQEKGTSGAWAATEGPLAINETADSDGDENHRYYSITQMPDGRFLLMYQALNVTDKDIKGVIINPAVTGVEGSPFKLYPGTIQPASDKKHPAIAAYGDSIIIVWSEKPLLAAPASIYYGYLNSDGTLNVETKTLVYTPTLGDSILPKIAINDDGFGVISWISSVSASAQQIYFKRFMF